MSRRHTSPAVLPAAILLLAIARKASAYVDPGSGAILWQFAAASVVGVLFYIRSVAAWIRRRVGMRSINPMGFLFAVCYALVASPLALLTFHAQPIPRYGDIFLVGIVLTAHRFTWKSASFLLALSIGLMIYTLRLYPTNGQYGLMPDAYRLVSFTAVNVFLICLVTRLRARAATQGSAASAPADKQNPLAQAAQGQAE